MTDYQLLVAWDVIEKINTLPVSLRRVLRDVFLKIVRRPDAMSDFIEHNPRGIALDVHLAHGYAIKYWTDFPDRHVKILDMELAD